MNKYLSMRCNAMVDRNEDKIICGDRHDVEMVNCLLENLRRAAELTGKLFSDERIVTENDVEELMITCTLLVNHAWENIKKDLNVDYVTRMMSCIAVGCFVERPDPDFKKSAAMAIADIGVSRMEILLHIMRLNDMCAHYMGRIE